LAWDLPSRKDDGIESEKSRVTLATMATGSEVNSDRRHRIEKSNEDRLFDGSKLKYELTLLLIFRGLID